MTIHTFTQDGITITINTSALSEQAVADQVINVSDWFNNFANMVFHKIKVSKSRMVKTELELALEEKRLSALPTTEDAIVQAVLAKPDYKNRAEREAV